MPAASVSADGKVLSLCWRGPDGKVIRLDQFRAAIDPLFAKQVREDFEWLTVDGATALWFPEPHRLTVRLLEPDGRTYRTTVRTAGPTLLWETPSGDRTLRLEGAGGRERAVDIAKSIRDEQRS